jgi:beta-lactamase class A
MQFMSSYHLRNEKKYKRRRKLIGATVILSVLALLMAGYLIINKYKVAGTSGPGGQSQSSSSAIVSTSSDSTVDVTDSQQSQATTSASTGASNTNIVNTEAHGKLPKVGTLPKSGKTDELKSLISNYTSKLPGKYGVTFIDLATGEMVNVNDKIEYIAASTSKLPVNVLLYKNIESGKVKLDQKLVYLKEDLEAGTGSIQRSPYGTEYTVKETSKRAIRQSDNCGVNMLIRLLGIDNVRNYIDQVGGQVHYGKTHRSCPYDMAQIAQDLYKMYLNNESVYGGLINDMENTDWHDRIDANLPKEVKVAHKIGNQLSTRNDVGIVFATHPYVLSVMTANVNEDAACKSIAELSRKVYDFEEAYASKTPVVAK